MFDNPLHYTNLKFENLSLTVSDNTLPDNRTIFKTKARNNKPYLIYLEQFGELYFFIKFFPSKYASSPDKYKIRTGLHLEIPPIRLFSTCLEIVVKKMIDNPDSCFGFYGQWDNTDIEKCNESSQRYKLWIKIAYSKIDSAKYEFVYDEVFNFFLVVPKAIYSQEFKNKTQKFFEKRFSNNLAIFRVPAKNEVSTKHL